MNTDVMFSSKTDLWETPQALFDELNSEFHFSLDVCAIPENAKCEKYYSPEVDGLRKSWVVSDGGGVVQSSLWQTNREMGSKGKRNFHMRSNSRHALACANRYKVVSRVHLQERLC